MELPRANPACPASIPSKLGVPVEVVGRPSIGEGRTPGNGAGDADGAISEEDAEPNPGIERDIPTLRLRN